MRRVERERERERETVVETAGKHLATIILSRLPRPGRERKRKRETRGKEIFGE